jgi:mRNA interferase HigB
MGTSCVTVYGESRLTDFANQHSNSRRPLARFLALVRQAEWRHLMDLKQTFSTADYTASGTIVFDVGGNKYRVLAAVDFEDQSMDIRAVLTHEEYNRESL